MTPADLVAVATAAAPALVAWRRADLSLSAAARVQWASVGGVALLGAMALGGAGATLTGAATPAGLILAGLVALVAATALSFSARYMAADPRRALFARRMLALGAAALTMALAGDAVTFLIGWVGAGLLLARLIGHDDGWAAAQAAARRTRVTFLAGDAALAAGVGMLAWQAGTLSLDAIASAAAAGPLTTLAAFLILAGALARSALPPAHGWLMTSMTAPTPVSAMMHAGLVNAGGFALIRFADAFRAAPEALAAAFALGAVAALVGGAAMLARGDVKRSLAGSTIAQMGFMMMQCGLGAFAHALFHIVAHGLFKAALFLAAGGQAGQKAAPKGDAAQAAALTLGAAAGVALVAPGAFGGASTLLSLFAFAAVAQGAVGLFAARPGLGAALAAVGLIGLAVASYVVGLGAVSAALGPAMSPQGALGLLGWAALAAFLAAWLAMGSARLRARLLPPAAQAALVNLGRTPAAYGARRAL